jgi:hypothetical protein
MRAITQPLYLKAGINMSQVSHKKCSSSSSNVKAMFDKATIRCNYSTSFMCSGSAVLLSCCTAVLLYCCTAVLLYCCPAVLLYCCPAVLLYCCPAVLLSTALHIVQHCSTQVPYSSSAQLCCHVPVITCYSEAGK